MTAGRRVKPGPDRMAYLRARHEALELVLGWPNVAWVKSLMRLDSRANASVGHSHNARAAKARLVKEQRVAGAWMGVQLRECFRRHRDSADFVVVRLVRFGPRFLDSSNLDMAFKAPIDGIAKALGVDDGDAFVRYVCDQEKGPYAVTAALYVKWRQRNG